MTNNSAKDRGMAIINRRMVSHRELIDKLVQKGELREDAEQVADWMVEIGLINDVDYAAEIVRHYSARGYGRRRVEQELHRRGIAREHWTDALGELPRESDDAIDQFIQSKLRDAGLSDRREEKRVADALARRGYDWDEINAGIRRYKASLALDEAIGEDGYEI